MSDIRLTARNADLSTIVSVLEDQRARRLDLIVPANVVSAVEGNLVVADTETTQAITEEGVTRTAGSYRPTSVADAGIGSRLDIPRAFLSKLRDERVDMYDALVNMRLHGGSSQHAAEPEFTYPGFDKKILLRLLKGDEGDEGVLRAFLSPRFKFIDNLDVLLAIMQGIKEAGVDAKPSAMDLSEWRMFARFEVPQIAAYAPKLLEGYRSPFDGRGRLERAGDGFVFDAGRGWTVPDALRAAEREGQGYEKGKEPVVWAGIVASNSDVGGGARTIAPQIRVKVCKNGLTLTAETDRKVHLGSEQAEGIVDWSAETQEKELALITSQTVDAVKTWLSQEFLDAEVAKIEAVAGAPVDKPEETVVEVAKAAGFTKDEQAGILAHFLRGGAYTAGGVANAVTSYSQTVGDAERAHELDRKAVTAMNHAARLAS
jgi:hypothetical protein